MNATAGGPVAKPHVVLKGNAVMELDLEPYGATPDLILSWNTDQNKFNAHLDAQGIPNAYELHGNIDPETLSIAGQFKINDPQSPIVLSFTMVKQ